MSPYGHSDFSVPERILRAYVVNKRSAFSSVVSMVMFDVLKLMENFS